LHILLTDALTCPRCGPEWPLILVAERTENRRIQTGTLGCANCHTHFRVENGFADLRLETEAKTETETETEPRPSDEEAVRTAALLGVTEGPGLVLVEGKGAVNAAAIAQLVPGLEVIAAWPPMASQPETEGVTRVAIGTVLPFRNASMRGVALTGIGSEALIADAARVVAPRGRVVVLNGDASVAEKLEGAGLRVLARDERATVAARTAF